jgi:hypothetical protein
VEQYDIVDVMRNVARQATLFGPESVFASAGSEYDPYHVIAASTTLKGTGATLNPMVFDIRVMVDLCPTTSKLRLRCQSEGNEIPQMDQLHTSALGWWDTWRVGSGFRPPRWGPLLTATFSCNVFAERIFAFTRTDTPHALHIERDVVDTFKSLDISSSFNVPVMVFW